MELVEGQHFREYVRQDAAPPFIRFLEDEPGDHRNSSTLPLPAPPAATDPRAPSLCPDLGRLRDAARQAAAGIAAIHAAGKLHRDIKSSNVLVTRQGRVVVLDFGLVADIGRVLGEGSSIVAAGTPAYMSPEQFVGRDVSEASDWYSFGVVIFEALTGRPAFAGDLMEIYEQKRQPEPPAPCDVVPETPPELDALCRELLDPDPRRRPDREEILRRLAGRVSASRVEITREKTSPRARPFVGRHEQLSRLREAFEDSQAGRCVTVYVHGSSGIGKTALVRHFLGEIADSREVVLISGRCYEREAVPYKALDSLVDGLSQYLIRLPPEQVDALMPRDVLALVRMFPVLRRVEAVARAGRFVLEIPDVHELRRRAFGALRELIARLADRKPVVLFIDDLHWGDADSAALLAEVLRAPDAPRILLIATYRTEEAATSPLLRKLLSPGTVTSEARELPLSELSPEEARRLAAALLDGDRPGELASAESIALESEGNPFLIDELVRYAQAGEGRRAAAEGPVAGQAKLDAVIEARVSWLSPPARRLLEVIAVAGRPLEVGLARTAAALAPGDDPLGELRAAHLIRLRGTEATEQIEIYHDRLRHSLVGLISGDALRMHHRRLANALEASGRSDPETLTQHFGEAAERERAAEYAPLAAARAAQALAFDRAARLYQLALELHGQTENEQRRELRIRLGDALANAGRGAEAASSYLAAIRGSSAAQALELQRRAAEQLLRSGHLDVGLPVLREVLARIGLRLAEAPWAALLHFVFRRILIRVRGLRFRERDATQVAEEELMRIDACWSASMGLSMVDTIRGKDFQARHLLLALRAGEPYRIARAIANEAGYSATAGSRSGRRTRELVEKAVALAERVGRPQAIGIAQVAVGITAYLEGRWKESWELAERGERILRERCTGVAWELDTTHVYSLRALFYLGEIGELRARLATLLQEARDRDDLFAVTSLKTRHGYVAALAADQPEAARRELGEALAAWSRKGFHLQHFFALIAEVDIALYSGDAQRARALLFEREAPLKGSRLLRVELFRVEWFHARARAAVACAAGDGADRPGLLAEADHWAGRIEREGVAWARPLAMSVRGSVAAMRSDAEASRPLLEKSASDFRDLDMGLYAAAARYRLGVLEGNSGDRKREAEDWIARQGVRNASRMADLLVPGGRVPPIA
jgi:hypothetical protein